MTHASLFSGIGGFDLAAEWMGWENVFHCEKNTFCQTILKYYWPNSKQYEDIKTTDFSIWEGRIDILTGGFPCQPYSTAGKRKGTEDERHLWPEMLRAIREIRPRFVVGENVSGIINWSGGLVFEQVQADLENEGYEVFAFVLPAVGVNAPHKRERVWFVAYADKFNGNISGFRAIQISQLKKTNLFRNINTNTRGERWLAWYKQCFENARKNKKWRVCIPRPTPEFSCRPSDWGKFPVESEVCNGNDGFPYKLDGITISKHRNESIKAGGNAIVPQVALQIFKAINCFMIKEKKYEVG